ncbi:MAG: hypothetical protein F6J90_04540 [Moorea sp. SIOASIH]|uniref:hypothetical protein n=1 Tax=Moorena sp. SIOASIH TaxID=2607817 RepID=UPI0013B7EDAC|nr:hypothetical protein [Moorena sp. SIOASIH]NEO35624.1 hypothetical protein [Moorena sp. SIOASIH]
MLIFLILTTLLSCSAFKLVITYYLFPVPCSLFPVPCSLQLTTLHIKYYPSTAA